MTQVDPELDKSMTTMNQLQKQTLYQNFVKNHCLRMPHDDFQSLSFIPDPEPLENEFDNVYGQLISEKFCPSAMNNPVNKDLNEKNDSALTENEEIQLQTTLDSLCYTCGSQLLPEDHELSKYLSVRLNITCDSPIESTYFSCRIKKLDICYWCGESEDLVEPSDKLKAEWKTIYPLCAFCKENGKTWYKRAQKKYIQLSSNDVEKNANSATSKKRKA
ncbi:11025_t:CDS:2 [Racocetra fulgida]|uniref:11025_t:CDS:1 n=1 Tax=Racocetra fulgida TaxID=60492 RepID=A0A9N8YZS5_9GLOM|nr:11025_t:CDS:2 [Racocetra fulgida]